MDKEKCPCCGHYTFNIPNEENLNNHGGICPVCFWETDLFSPGVDEYSVVNHMTLRQGQMNYKEFGACEKEMLIHVRSPKESEPNPIK